MISQIAIVTEA